MKKGFLILLLSFMAFGLFAGPLIDAAKKRDYKTFEKLVKKNADLNETNEKGMNLQLALAYFDEKDFKKACTLLAKKGFDFDVPVANNVSLVYVLSYSLSYEKLETLLKYKVDINRRNEIQNTKPIDATLFSTFKFFSSQIIPDETYDRAQKTRDLLLKNGSDPLEPFPLTMANVGNGFFCIVNIVAGFNPYINPQVLNSSSLFDFTPVNGQEQATIKEDEMVQLFLNQGVEVTITNHYDPDEILDRLIFAEEAPDPYCLIINTGNNPIAPYQWALITQGGFDQDKSPARDLIISSPDALYDFVTFQRQDISQLILIKLNFLEEDIDY